MTIQQQNKRSVSHKISTQFHVVLDLTMCILFIYACSYRWWQRRRVAMEFRKKPHLRDVFRKYLLRLLIRQRVQRKNRSATLLVVSGSDCCHGDVKRGLISLLCACNVDVSFDYVILVLLLYTLLQMFLQDSTGISESVRKIYAFRQKVVKVRCITALLIQFVVWLLIDWWLMVWSDSALDAIVVWSTNVQSQGELCVCSCGRLVFTVLSICKSVCCIYRMTDLTTQVKLNCIYLSSLCLLCLQQLWSASQSSLVHPFLSFSIVSLCVVLCCCFIYSCCGWLGIECRKKWTKWKGPNGYGERFVRSLVVVWLLYLWGFLWVFILLLNWLLPHRDS